MKNKEGILEAIGKKDEWHARYRALSADDAEGMRRLIRDAGFDVTQEEALELLHSAQALSDENLEDAAGGTDRRDTIGYNPTLGTKPYGR